MSELVLRNRQRVRAVDLRQVRRLTRTLIEELLGLGDYELGVHLVAAPEMTRLNEQFLQHAGSTDVITFDYSDEPLAERTDLPKEDANARSRCRETAASWATNGGTFRSVPHSTIRVSHSAFDRASSRRLLPGTGFALHGEVFVCLDDAVAQAQRFGVTWQAEVVRYIVHGCLHLLGHDDLDPAARRRMKREENRLVTELAGRFRLSQLSRRPKVRP